MTKAATGIGDGLVERGDALAPDSGEVRERMPSRRLHSVRIDQTSRIPSRCLHYLTVCIHCAMPCPRYRGVDAYSRHSLIGRQVKAKQRHGHGDDGFLVPWMLQERVRSEESLAAPRYRLPGRLREVTPASHSGIPPASQASDGSRFLTGSAGLGMRGSRTGVVEHLWSRNQRAGRRMSPSKRWACGSEWAARQTRSTGESWNSRDEDTPGYPADVGLCFFLRCWPSS